MPWFTPSLYIIMYTYRVVHSEIDTPLIQGLLSGVRAAVLASHTNPFGQQLR